MNSRINFANLWLFFA